MQTTGLDLMNATEKAELGLLDQIVADLAWPPELAERAYQRRSLSSRHPDDDPTAFRPIQELVNE